MRGRDLADLTRNEPQAPAMKRFTERGSDFAAAVPAQLDDARLFTGKPQRDRKAGGGGACVKHHVAIRRCRSRKGKPGAKRMGQLGARRQRVDHGHFASRQAGAQIGHQQPEQPTAHYGDAIGRPGGAIPYCVERGFHIGGQHGAHRRNAGRDRQDRLRRQREDVLVRMQAEYHLPLQFRRPDLYAPYRGVAVLHRERKRATHQRRAHTLVLALRDAAGMHESLGTTADRSEQRPHPHLAECRGGDRFLAQFGQSGADVPKRFTLHCVPNSRCDGFRYILKTPERHAMPSAMLERSSGDKAAAVSIILSAWRPAVFFICVAATMAGFIWLAAFALSPGGIGTLDLVLIVLFAVTLPWYVIGFWNAAIGFVIMRFA